LTPRTPESRIIGEAKPAPVEKLMIALITGSVIITQRLLLRPGERYCSRLY
jgi:hypothetical protein